jgi:hypothetical protein
MNSLKAFFFAGSKIIRSPVDGVELIWRKEHGTEQRFATRDFDESEDQLTSWALSCWPLDVTLDVSYVIYFRNGLVFRAKLTCDHFGLSLEGQTLREHLLAALLFTVGELNPDLLNERGISRELTRLDSAVRFDTATRLNAARILMVCVIPVIYG